MDYEVFYDKIRLPYEARADNEQVRKIACQYRERNNHIIYR